MGRGIAQLAAQAGSSVFLFDTQSSASAAAQTAVFSQWDKLQDKGRLEQAQVAGYKSRLHCVASLAASSLWPPSLSAIASDVRILAEFGYRFAASRYHFTASARDSSDGGSTAA